MARNVKPIRVVWSACHTHQIHAEHLFRVMDAATREGVSGVELVGNSVDDYIGYRDYPAAAATVDRARLRGLQDALRRVVERAVQERLRFGIWHHELAGPKDLLNVLPHLRAADGLVDLDSPPVYDFVRSKVTEFFDLFPGVDELVLTMTETAVPVAHRPFCDIPAWERIRRLLSAITDVTEPRGKQLVIRPFSAVREDELAVRQAVQALPARRLAMMYKTEFSDWHAFLPNEELIGTVPGHEVRAETDCGAEYYGQSVFPCSYTGHIGRRLSAAIERGATVAVLRVDRGPKHPALSTPINEVNVLAPTRWLQEPGTTIAEQYDRWLAETHGCTDPRLQPLLEQTWRVVEQTFYADKHGLSHHLFPSLESAMASQEFHIFEEGVPLSHMVRNWGVLSDRRAPTHAFILKEKESAMALARRIIADFEAGDWKMKPESRASMSESLSRLPLIVEAFQILCRLTIAHLREVWGLPDDLTDGFSAEAERMLRLAQQIEDRFGSDFFRRMPERMRGWVSGLSRERQIEIPLRRELAADPCVRDYVLCGIASEGHRLAKRLHVGTAREYQGRFIRTTGAGPEQGVTYHLRVTAGKAGRLSVLMASDGSPRPGIVQIGSSRHDLPAQGFQGFLEQEFPVEPWPAAELPVSVWSTSPQPCWVSQLTLRQGR